MVREMSPEGTDRADAVGGAAHRIEDPESVPVRSAVSVLLLRDGETGIETFVQHRVRTMDFAAGVVVFPGGRVDPVDTPAAAEIVIEDVGRHTDAWKSSDIAEVADGWRVLLATAVREVHEETGAVLDPVTLRPWANWVTPLGLPKRFDTYFYVTSAADTDPAAASAPHHQTTEASRSEWMPVADILAAEIDGRLKLMRPTLTLLGELSSFATVAEVLSADHTVVPVRPDFPSGRG